jgi:spermidine synthase
VSRSADSNLLPLLWLLFAASGCAALIYEIVWFQLLQLVIGTSTLSLAVLLGTFMGGMCLGALALPRALSPGRHPMKVYAGLEITIGVMGVLATAVAPAVTGIDLASEWRAALAAACLLPPAAIMGATLPALSRSVEVSRTGISWLGLFYAGNIAGAVFGSVLAGFYLLRIYDVTVATAVAVTINIFVAIVALWLAGRVPSKLSLDGTGRLETSHATKEQRIVYLAVALSGFGALGAEAVWTRTLSLVFGATVYTFSIIVAVFLAGLGIGSGAASVAARHVKHPRRAFALCQVFLSVAIAWASWSIAYSLPYWRTDPAANAWQVFEVDVVRCVWAIFPAACLWGTSLPLALAAIVRRNEDPGRLISRVYAANTVGAIAGAAALSMLILPWGGSEAAQRGLVAVSAVSGVILLGRRRGSLVLAAAIAAFSAWIVPPLPGLLIAYGRELSVWAKTPPAVRYAAEGLNASVAVTEWPSGVRNFHVSGKIEASTAARDMRLQRMLGHLPALIHPNPRSVLIVGFGAGVTAGSFVLYPGIERIVICEIEPLIPRVVSTYFQMENYDVLHDPRVQVVYDDARHYVLTTREKFDVITSDPIHPWVKGAAALYSTEYFENVRKRLNPGGVVSQWAPLYDSTEDVVKSELATFFKTFGNGTVWSSDIAGRGYDTVLIGQEGRGEIDLNGFAERLARKDHQRAVASLAEVNFEPALSLLATYAGSAVDLQPWLQGAEITTDRNFRLQYLAGLVTNRSDPEGIYRSLLYYREFPEHIFTGSSALRERLRQMLNAG